MLSKTNQIEFDRWREIAVDEGASAMIDKPLGWTSFDVVAKLRNLLQIKKVGHAGTLDPLADGLLILCFGKATKTIESYQNLKKKYSATVKLGATTKTFDSEAGEENIKSLDNIDNQSILETLDSFVGTIMQVPPIFSAKKIGGKRLYKLARQEKTIEIKPVEIQIYKIDEIEINLPFVRFNVECSKGSYIRSLANDFGAKLGCGGYLSALRRIAIGEYEVENAITINEFIEHSTKHKFLNGEDL